MEKLDNHQMSVTNRQAEMAESDSYELVTT